MPATGEPLPPDPQPIGAPELSEIAAALADRDLVRGRTESNHTAIAIQRVEARREGLVAHIAFLAETPAGVEIADGPDQGKAPQTRYTPFSEGDAGERPPAGMPTILGLEDTPAMAIEALRKDGWDADALQIVGEPIEFNYWRTVVQRGADEMFVYRASPSGEAIRDRLLEVARGGEPTGGGATASLGTLGIAVHVQSQASGEEAPARETEIANQLARQLCPRCYR